MLNRNKYVKLITLFLILCLPVIGVLAGTIPGSSSQTVNGSVSPNANTGFHDVFAYRIGLSQCLNEEVLYDISAGKDAKALAVQTYAAKYYTPLLGPSVYVTTSGSLNPKASVDYSGLSCTPASSPALTDILSTIASGSGSSTYIMQLPDGTYCVPPDEAIVSQVMSELKALGGANEQLYNHWVEEQTSSEAAKHPVVICIEMVGEAVNDGSSPYWLGSADLAARIAGSGARSALVTTNLSSYGTADLSKTLDAMASFCGFKEGTPNWDNWPYRATKHLFATKFNVSGGKEMSTGLGMYSDVAKGAWQTLSGSDTRGINGITVVAVGGGSAEIAGTYTWHINAARLPANADGYKEDNTADSEGDKTIGIGAVNIKQSNAPAWFEWISMHGPTFTVVMDKFYRAGDTFSLEYSDVVGSRSSSVNSLSSGKDQTTLVVTASELWNYVTAGSDLDINGMNAAPLDTLGGSPIGEDRYQVAYATTVKIVGADGTSLTLTNEDVHYAIYGSNADKTYTYNQILAPGMSQVKQGDGGLGTEEYEAMSGTPTTKDLFISQGAEQFLVQLQFRYVDEAYKRDYTLKSASAYPNFMYYKTSGSNSGSSSASRNNDENGKTSNSHDWVSSSEKASANSDAYSNSYNALRNYVNGFTVDNNYGAATDYDKYAICSPQKTDNVQAMKDYVNSLPSAGQSASYSKSFTLCQANDLDSPTSGEVTVTVTFHGGMSENTGSSGYHTHDGCSYLPSKPAVGKPGTPEYIPGESGGWQCGEPDNRWGFTDNYDVKYNWSVSVDYGPFSASMKNLEYTNNLQQVFEHVRYMDIVEVQLFRLEGGKQVGLGKILAGSTEETLLEMACAQMGYALYDSEQASARKWNGSKKMWTAVNINDYEATGRALNSYGKTTVDLALADGNSAEMIEDADNVLVTYDFANGGRSHYSYESYMARVAGTMFYEDNSGNKPYRNTMFVSSDVFAINTGDSSTSGYESFTYNDIDTEKVVDIAGQEQYLMAKGNNLWVQFRSKTFKKNDRSAPVGTGSPSFQNTAYLSGIVDLNKMDSAGEYVGKYNKEWICETNPYTFVDKIPESGGITWVGYRGDYLTTLDSHAPNLKCISGFTPDMSKAIMGEEYYGKVFAGTAKNLEEKPSPTNAFPHKESLNVNRTQENNLYKTGYASVYYNRAERIDHTSKSGVTPLAPLYAGANLNTQHNSLKTTSPKCSIRAVYGAGWDTPNDVVIFNPSTAENAYIYKASEYIPDAAEVGGDNPLYPVRDQRVKGYYMGTDESSGIFVENGTLSNESGDLPVRVTKSLKPISEVATSYYTIDKDYNMIKGTDENEAIMTANSIFTAPMSTSYKFAVYDATGQATAVRVKLQKGDVVKTVDGDLYKQSNQAVVTFSDYINSKNTDIKVDNPYIITDTRIDSYILTELTDIKAGDVIHLRYAFEDRFDKSSKPFDVDVVLDRSTAVADKLITTVDGYTWDYYIEFKEDCVVDKLNVSFNKNTKLSPLPSNEYMFEFVDSFIMSPGEAYSNPANESTTIDFMYLKNRTCAYNINFVDYDTDVYEPGDVVAYRYYIKYSKDTVSYSIKKDSSSNPHVVYNANWKYYVMGWKTKNGNVIESPTDALLDKDDTVLLWPSGIGNITVGELKNSACLVKYNNSVYLTTKEAGLEHKILEKGWTVSAYDIFTFGADPTSLSLESVNSPIATDYPIAPGMSGKVFHDYKYEFFFSLLSGSSSDRYLYDVQYALNTFYRFDKDDTGQMYNRDKWSYDWNKKETPMDSNSFGNIVKDFDKEATYITLDDRFSIHFDNIGNYRETDWHNQGSTNVDLGYGYVDNLDTITWIEHKYVRFPFDVYVFGYNETYGLPDATVTYEEYMKGTVDAGKHVGNIKTGLQYIPGGTAILLGKYEGDSGAADNAGHFIDFGSNNGYDYNFWTVLSANECTVADVKFVSSNINCIGDTEQNKINNNKDTPSAAYSRFANAMRIDPLSVVGRIGNLNMLDTGDYRFSDTFKTVSRDAGWLVYGLIKKLSPYSNVNGTPSTQDALLLDPWDVRGRLGIPALTNIPGYTTYNNTGYSTYNTQWHKVGDKTRIESLPLTGSFNKHDALKLTQQKIGYANLLTVDTIGNYFGSSGEFSTDSETSPINPNGDYGNMKVQVRPYYIAIDTTGSVPKAYPVDVYMRTATGYSMINTGSVSAATVIQTLTDNAYNVYLSNNTEKEDAANKTFKLDQNMLRRMVTDQESSITWSVLNNWKGTDTTRGLLSMLTNVKESSDSHSWDLDNMYTYGNGQYMFLRDRNRTFVGNNSVALNYSEGDVTSTTNYMSHAQMYYFDLGLPTSAVFVPTGEDFDVSKVINKKGVYVMTCVDIYAMGEVWQLHYKSPLSASDVEIAGKTISPDIWNPNTDKLKWLVPVTFYDTSETGAKDDLTTEGSH